MKLSNEEVINEIRAGGVRQEKMLRKIHDSCYPFIYKALQKHQLTKEQAIDAYTDTLVVFRRNIIKGSFRGESKYSTYFYSIFFKRCLNAIRDSGTNKHIWEYELPIHLHDRNANISKLLEVDQQWKILNSYLSKLADKCREILLDALYYGYKMEEIAERHGYKDAQSMRNKKYTCLKQLKMLIQTSYGKEMLDPH